MVPCSMHAEATVLIRSLLCIVLEAFLQECATMHWIGNRGDV